MKTAKRDPFAKILDEPRIPYGRSVARLRRIASEEIERLITFLDRTEADADLEDDEPRDQPNGDEDEGADSGVGDPDGLIEQTTGEPSLGSFDRMANQEKSYLQRGAWLGSYPDDSELDDADREPSLGARESHPSVHMQQGSSPIGHQLAWGCGARDDREDEHDGREPDDHSEWQG